MSAGTGLRALQEAFARALVRGEDEAVIASLAGDPAAARRGLAIYRNAVSSNAHQALRSAYPVVERLVGEAFFAEAARQHLASVPSTSGDLNCYGDAFSAFLASYGHASSLPWLADVARLEWAWHEALMAADAPTLDVAALARVPAARQPGIRFDVHPSVRVVRSPWPVLAIWEANQPDRDGVPDREEGPEAVLAWREGPQVRLARLAPPEADFLERVMAGETLEAAADVPGEWNLPETLRRLAGHGVLCGFAL